MIGQFCLIIGFIFLIQIIPFIMILAQDLEQEFYPNLGLVISASLEKSVFSSFDAYIREVLKEVCHMLEQI